MKKTLSLLLSLLMILTLLPVSVFADTDEPGAEPEVLPAAAEESQEQSADEPKTVEDPADEPETVPEPAAEPENAEPQADAEPLADDPQTCTITYSAVGATSTRFFRDTVEVGAQVTLRGKTYSKNPDVSYDGLTGTAYVQDGWMGDRLYELGETITVTGDMSLSARFAESEQVHWIVKVVGGNGKIKFVRGLNSQTEERDTQIKVYVTSQRTVPTGTYRYFEGEPDSGCVFDGWYLDGEKLDQPKLVASMFPTLTNTRVQNNQNVIEARFKQNAGSIFTVTYDRGDGYIYKQEAVEAGSATPTCENPYYKNHYFLGWTPAVSDTVTGDVTYTATWLEGPSASLGNVGGSDPDNENTFFTLHCITGNGVDGRAHEDMGRNATQFESNDDITFDGTTYRATVSITGLGSHLLWATDSYDRTFRQEHFSVERTPVVRVKWDEGRKLWVPDGTQIVEIYHETGTEALSAAKQKSFDAICVTDVNEPTTYKKLKLIPGTYELSDPVPNTNNSEYMITATVTDFEAYASQLGSDYVVDWSSNLHEEDYYVFYFVNKLSLANCANGDTYYQWSGFNFSPMNTAWQSTGGVKHNEFLYGKELLVKEEHTHEWSDPTYEWIQDGNNWTCKATRTCAGCEEAETETVTADRTEANDVATYTATFTNEAFETQTKEVEIGYYLTGTIADWGVDEDYRFAPNGAAAGEYILNTSLAVGDEIKVIRAEGSTILSWYPADGGNYIVDYAHSGTVNVYFRPTGNGDWQSFHQGGFFYISRLHTVTVITDGNGTATLNPDTPDVTATVYMTFTPNEGYCLDHVDFYRKTGEGENDLEPVNFTLSEENTFVMPDFDVVIKVFFKVIPVYTITYDIHDEMYDHASFDDGRVDYYYEEEWAPRTAHYGDRLADYLPSASAEEHWRQYYTVVYEKYLLDGWMTGDGEPVTADSIVTGDVVIRPMKVELPDVTRIVDYIVSGPEDEDPSFGTSGYSRVENVTGTPVILRCLSDGNDTISLTGYDAMGLFSGGALQVDEYEKAADGTWTGRIHLRYQSYNWSGMIHSLTSGHNVTSGLMTYLVETGKISEFHKLVDNSFPSQGYKDGGYVEVRYDRDTEKWEFTTTKTIDVYCGFQLIYVDSMGESDPFFVKPDENGEAELPVYEADLTPPVEGAVFLGYRDNWNKPANPGDEGYTRTNANGDPVYSTATFFVPMGVEYLESYPSVPNTDDPLFILGCETDLFEEGHEVPVTYRLLQAAGVTPEFGELDTYYGMYFVQDMTFTAEQIDQVLEYLSSEDIQGNGMLSDYFLEMRHQLLPLEEGSLTITMICLDVDVPENWAPTAGTGALPGGLSTMGVGGHSAAQPKALDLGGRTSNVIGGTWVPLNPLVGEDLDVLPMRCMVNVFFLNAQADFDNFDWENPLTYLEENGDEIIFEACTGLPFLIRDEDTGKWIDNPDLAELLAYFTPEEISEWGEEAVAALTNDQGAFFTDWKAMTFAGEEVELPEVIDQNLILFPQWVNTYAYTKSATASFKDDIRLNIYLEYKEDGEAAAMPEGVKLMATIGESTEEISFANVAHSSSGYRFTFNLKAKQVEDVVNLKLVDSEGHAFPFRSSDGSKNYTDDGFEYSLLTYFDYMVDNGPSEEMRNLAKAAMDYCYAAKHNFGYGDPDSYTVSAAVDAVTADDLSGYAAVDSQSWPEGVSFKQSTAMFETDNSYRLYMKFTNDPETASYVYTVDSTSGGYEMLHQNDRGYYLTFTGVKANKLNKVHTLKISDGTTTEQLKVSVLTYARSVILNSNEQNMVTLAKALYLYNQAAIAKFGA